jgi:hypothetical protein
MFTFGDAARAGRTCSAIHRGDLASLVSMIEPCERGCEEQYHQPLWFVHNRIFGYKLLPASDFLMLLLPQARHQAGAGKSVLKCLPPASLAMSATS